MYALLAMYTCLAWLTAIVYTATEPISKYYATLNTPRDSFLGRVEPTYIAGPGASLGVVWFVDVCLLCIACTYVAGKRQVFGVRKF